MIYMNKNLLNVFVFEIKMKLKPIFFIKQKNN
ncbi:hypothetical protein C8C84_1533 [Flavobacterium sp. 102]|nr:hypothetical protein C8C84_1533 [Flavobacterium sp. 102]